MKLQKNQKGNRIIRLLLLVLMLVLPMGSVQAQTSGTIELHFGEDALQVEMTLYSVADYVDGSFQYHGAFEGCGISLEGVVDAEEAEHVAQQLAVIAQENGVDGIAKTVDESGILRFSDLQPAYYLLVQSGGLEYVNVQMVLVPIPYTSEDGTLSYTASLSPKYSVPDGAVILTKIDEDGNAVEQAVFRLEKKEYVSEDGELPEGTESGQDVGGRYFWKLIRENLATNEAGELAVMNLPFGTYRFVETSAPEGYVLNAAPNYVSVELAGQITEVNGFYETESGTPATLTVLNEQTRVVINKVDEQGNPVSGARLVVKSADGKAIVDEDDNALYAFVSGEEPYELKRLPAGDYLLSEVEAPEGYEVSVDVPFTVDDTNGAVNEVTMVDHPMKETDVKLTVTKTLEDQHGYAVTSEDAVFYVALFEDAEYTKRVSDVRVIHFSNTSSESIVFENLEAGKTYYIVETDPYGELLDGIPYIGGVFAPEYPQGNAVTLTPQDPEQEFTFKNIFYELPQDYYYIGDITIQKSVLRGDKPYESQAVFYAGIFTDEACTQLYGEVLKLSMDGKAETSVTATVSVGRLPDGIATYYIAETDSTGKALSASDGLNFTISIDQPSVTLSPENPSVKAVITNSYEEDEEWQSEEQTEQQSEAQTLGEGTSTGSSNAVKTGDETPVGMMIVVMMVAAAVVFFIRKRGINNSY